MKNNPIKNPTIVSTEKWLAARREFLREEKEFTHLRERLAARRRELPWVKIDKAYTFESPGGRVSLADLFEGRSQLVVYHFMFGPGWEEGCKSCSYVSDHFDGALPHVNARGVSFTAISSAPLEEIELRDAPPAQLGPALEKRIVPGAHVVALDMAGVARTSEQFARWLDAKSTQGKGNVVLVIGGADGLPPSLLVRALEKLSLSAMTFPHRLARLVLAEQLYRAVTILRNEPYARL